MQEYTQFSAFRTYEAIYLEIGPDTTAALLKETVLLREET